MVSKRKNSLQERNLGGEALKLPLKAIHLILLSWSFSIPYLATSFYIEQWQAKIDSNYYYSRELSLTSRYLFFFDSPKISGNKIVNGKCYLYGFIQK